LRIHKFPFADDKIALDQDRQEILSDRDLAIQKMKKMTETNSYNSTHSENSSSMSELVKKEQDYRHKWQNKFLKSHFINFRIGQIFGFIYNAALLYLVYDLVKSGEKKLAAIIFVTNAAIIAFGLLVTSVERKIINKKPMRKNRDDRGGFRGNNNKHRHPRR